MVNCLAPVSYTHLDVYKRQVKHNYTHCFSPFIFVYSFSALTKPQAYITALSQTILRNADIG